MNNSNYKAGDFFRKIVILDGNAKAWTDEEGIMYIGVIPFLLEENSLNIAARTVKLFAYL